MFLQVLLILIFFILICLLAFIHWEQNYSPRAQGANQFPGPKLTLFVGNVLEFYLSAEELFIKIIELTEKYNTTWRIWSTHICGINIVNAEDAEAIFLCTKNITKSIFYDFLHPWLGTGLLTSTGKKWQHRRKLLTPAFHFNILKRFVEIFGEHSQTLVENLKTECYNPKTNVRSYCTQTALQIISETAMGINLNADIKTKKSYFDAIHFIGYSTFIRIISPWLYIDFIFKLFPIGRKYFKSIDIAHKFTNKVIKEREANFNENDVKNLDDDDFVIGRKKRLAMLDLLISAKRNDGSIDDAGLREEVETFMFEGHDTISSSLGFTLMLLANHREIQDKVYVELEEIFSDSNRKANYDDLQKMHYLEMCLKESLRLYPSVPAVSRLISEDLKLSTGTIPAGTYAIVIIGIIHRDPKHFPEPDKFDPNRFLPENSAGRHHFSYVPFSAGSRNCIGQRFAMLEMKSVISAILRNYILEPITTAEDLIFKTDLVLRTTNDIYVKFKSRVK